MTENSRVEATSSSTLDKIEQGAKIFATAAIPILVALGGWLIQGTVEKDKEAAAAIERDRQNAVEKDKISLEYVKIAKEILTSTEKNLPSELTTWSWKVLDGVSPVKFDSEALKRLIERQERIPSPTSTTSFELLAPEYNRMFNAMN